MKNEIIESRKEFSLETLKKYKESFLDYLDDDILTVKTYKVGIQAFIDYIQEKGIKMPNRDDVIAFRNMLRENYSSNTVNTYMIGVRALFKYLEIHKLYENICVDIKGAKYSNTPKKQVLSLEQAKEIYSSLTDQREKCLFGLLITTGLRGIEVARAEIQDIEIFNNERIMWVWGKKHDSKDEFIKLSDQVYNDIKEYVGDRTSGYIFVSNSNHNKNNGVTTTTLRRIIKSIFKRFGLDSDTFSLHSCRRTSATLMYQNDINVRDIQQVLRHKNLNTTMRYINAITRNQNNAEQVISNLLFN